MSNSSSQDSHARSALDVQPPIEGRAVSRQYGTVVRIVATLTAGLLTWLIVQAVHPVFSTDQGRDQVGFLPVDVQWRLDRNNAMFVLALLGGLSGIGLALGAGARRDTWKAEMIAAAKCGAVGAVFGALAGYLGHRVFEIYKPNADVTDLSKAIRVNGAMFATLGGGVGLGVGWFFGQSSRAAADGLVRGLLAGVLASLMYLLIVATLIPGAMTTVLLPQEAAVRLLWFGLFSGLLGAFVTVAHRTSRADPSV